MNTERAFPSRANFAGDHDHEGATLVDIFAMQALNGLISGVLAARIQIREDDYREVVRSAYKFAHEMLNQRDALPKNNATVKLAKAPVAIMDPHNPLFVQVLTPDDVPHLVALMGRRVAIVDLGD